VEDGTEKLCSMHFSVSDTTQQEDEYFPLSKHREEIARTKRELVFSTMAGGLLGGYWQEDFPFYFINERMLEHLGYKDEAEFTADIGGMIINGIHPDDRAFVNEQTRIQLSKSDLYTVDYRMKMRDQSYIWVHDIGRKTISEDGKEVIISVCYDITQEHEKQAQLDNLVNALPGGVALYRLVNGDFKILYQSNGVSALFGMTPAEFEALSDADIKNTICPEDEEIVFAALLKASGIDEVVSIDYRIPHISGGYVWISGSFKRTSIENGCPVIHAVFTEMPQQRELINSLTEDSGTGIVVSDDATHELLYINSAMRRILGMTDSNYTGKTCYEYLMGLDSPCSFCKHGCLGKNGDIESDIYYPKLDKYFMTLGRLTQWAGRAAHIEYLTDITAGKKAQKQLYDLVQNISSGVVVSKADPADGSYDIEYMNSGFCNLFEDTEQSLRLRYKSDITVNVHPEDLEKVAQIKKQLQNGALHTDAVLRYTMRSGKTKWLRLDINAVPLADGKAMTYATYNDVTSQIQQERQLQDVIHNVPGGVCLYRWDGSKLCPIVVSEQFSALLGEDAKITLEQTNGIQYRHVHPDDLAELQRKMLDSFEHTKSFEFTYRSFSSKSKQYIWLYCQGNVVSQDDGTKLAYVSYTDITRERLTAQKLRASERALDAATEQADLWYWNYDPSSDTAYFNERCMRNANLPEALENYPRSWLDMGYIMPEYESVYADAVARAKIKDAQVVFEAQVLFSDGVVHWAEFRFTNLPDENGKQGIVVCTSHIIDEAKALSAKYELEKQKPSLGEKDLLIHATFNLKTGQTLDYDYAPRLGNLTHDFTTMKEAIETVADTIVEKNNRDRFLELNDISYLKTQLNQGIIDFSMDYRRRMPDGQIIWVRNIFHLVREPDTGDTLLFEYCYNIHRQKMALEVLNSVTTYDYERIASVNFNIGKMMYYGVMDDIFSDSLIDYDTVIREYADEYVIDGERERYLLGMSRDTVINAVAKDGYYGFTVKIKQADGAYGIIKTRFVPYDNEHNIYIMTRTNVTGILREEEEKNSRLREALAIAEQANTAKTDFLSAMSHDIRTPMNAIVGMCGLALEDESDREQIHESLDTINSSSQLLLSLINNILDMSRIESGKMVLVNEPFSVTQQINETTASYKALAEQKHQVFELKLNITHDACNGDIARIHSAIDNILSNAIKYTPEGGKITYSVSEHTSGNPGIGLYRFEISDTGIGISEEKQKHLFEPFYRGETDMTSKIEGTGLGLSIAKAIIDLKGGTISIKSAEGAGTTFIVELPLHLAEGNEVSSEPLKRRSESVCDLSGTNILLCEDHPINQKVVKRMLEKAHAEVTVADNGKLGYEIFSQSGAGDFDVILMDIQMPKMNGYEATRLIRGSSHPQAKTIPIIALSANAFSEDVQKSMCAGMNAHLAKPIEPKTLLQTLCGVLRKNSADSE